MAGEARHLHVRRYGPEGPTAIVLHGGPGAAGNAGPLAKALADPLHILEPWQRSSADGPQSVDQHVADLADVITHWIPGARPALLMLHGSYDPHPGALVRESLAPHLPQLEYQEFEKCGHSPWVEEHARDDFLAVARRWLDERLGAADVA